MTTAPAPPATAADVLDAAADLLLARGWIQNFYIDPDVGDRCCALGAIRLASGMTPDQVRYTTISELSDAALQAENVLATAVGRAVPFWNDVEGRTQDEVVAKLREVAAAERAS